MGKPIASLLTTLLVLVSPLCFGQIHTVVSHPVLEVSDQEVHIFYDIINSGPNDRFNISVLITDTQVQELISSLLPGDVGANISGGVQKHIVWDLKKNLRVTHYAENAWSRGLNYNNSYINRSSDRKGDGASVCCVKNEPVTKSNER